MLLIYTSNITPRLQYIAGVLLSDISGLELSYTTHSDDFRSYEGPKINYSGHSIAEGELLLKPAGLLFETGIKPQEIVCNGEGKFKIFFATKESDYPFDIFAASFYLLSRYEEYLPYQPDYYGRFSHTESLACKEGFLQQPLINYWLADFKKVLLSRFPQLIFSDKKFNFLPSYDIDIAFSYLYKGWRRNAGGLARSLMKGRFYEIRDRITILITKKDDPFDIYEWLDTLHLKYNLKPFYFFPVNTSGGKYDKNISPRYTRIKELILRHAKRYEVGIHPSWQSGDKEQLLQQEIQTLGNITGREVMHSRQHYLRFTLPDTYQQLIQQGILHEFSMGYGTINGFRASIASSFLWYDLLLEKKSPLRIYPFCFMDTNAFFKQKLTPAETFSEMEYYYDTIKKINGTMISIWHNHILCREKIYGSRRVIYQQFLEEKVYRNS